MKANAGQPRERPYAVPLDHKSSQKIFPHPKALENTRDQLLRFSWSDFNDPLKYNAFILFSWANFLAVALINPLLLRRLQQILSSTGLFAH